jgi:hypothetical protein
MSSRFLPISAARPGAFSFTSRRRVIPAGMSADSFPPQAVIASLGSAPDNAHTGRDQWLIHKRLHWLSFQPSRRRKCWMLRKRTFAKSAIDIHAGASTWETRRGQRHLSKTNGVRIARQRFPACAPAKDWSSRRFVEWQQTLRRRKLKKAEHDLLTVDIDFKHMVDRIVV